MAGRIGFRSRLDIAVEHLAVIYVQDFILLVVNSASIEAVKIITPEPFSDSRGVLFETYNRKRFAEHGIALEFVQDTQSTSVKTGTIRGLHFQSSPAAQDKLVRVLRGSIFGVAVDLRRSSPSYGKWTAEELSAANGKQMLVPIGFAHGFCTLEPDTQVFYKVTAYYSPANDLGIAWNDPDLAITWPAPPERAVLSDRDTRQPRFNPLASYFE
jgi:dTDP-4-dehydrorhamnose 3,5-epimerase